MSRILEKLDKEKLNFRYIQVSTDEVYGSLTPTQMPLMKVTNINQITLFSFKTSSDLLVRSYYKTFGFPSIITNCSNNYDPYQYPEKLIPLTISKLYKKNIPIYEMANKLEIGFMFQIIKSIKINYS